MVAKQTAARVALTVLSLAHLVLGGSTGCAAPMTPGQRARDAAHEYAMAVRFGRLDLAIERVGSAHRQDFSRRHAAWGGPVRILDCELVSVALRAQEQAEAVLVVGWQRVAEGDVRTTQILQHWRNQKGEWVLEGEERSSGDVGLLGEAHIVVQPAATSGRAQFPSITIGGQAQ